MECVAIVIGVLLGFIFSTSGWQGSKKPVELKNDPRVISLKWAIGIGMIGFLGSWKELMDDEQISRSAVGGYYAISFVTASLAGLILMTIIVMFGAKAAQKREPIFWPQRGFSPVLEFWIFGYQRYQYNLNELIEKNRRENDDQELVELKNIISESTFGLAACILASDRCLAGKFKLEYVVEQILIQITTTSKYYLKNKSHVNANWMLAIHPHELTNSHRNRILWSFGDESRYEFYLEIKDHMNRNQSQDFLLPVEKIGSEGLRKYLPGAPEAFMRRKEVFVSVNALKYPKDVPKNIKLEIAEYFSTQPFKSFVSLIIPGDKNTPIGIVNIETDNQDAVKDNDRMQQLSDSLQPFLALLSLMIRYERSK